MHAALGAGARGRPVAAPAAAPGRLAAAGALGAPIGAQWAC